VRVLRAQMTGSLGMSPQQDATLAQLGRCKHNGALSYNAAYRKVLRILKPRMQRPVWSPAPRLRHLSCAFHCQRHTLLSTGLSVALCACSASVLLVDVNLPRRIGRRAALPSRDKLAQEQQGESRCGNASLGPASSSGQRRPGWGVDLSSSLLAGSPAATPRTHG